MRLLVGEQNVQGGVTFVEYLLANFAVRRFFGSWSAQSCIFG